MKIKSQLYLRYEAGADAVIVKTRCPDLDKTWGMIDGLNLGCLNSTNEVLQNSSYTTDGCTALLLVVC